MRRRGYLTLFLAGILAVPFSLAHADQTLQQRYLDIYLKINDAEHLESQGDFRGALDDFKDCYDKLSKIHDSDPSWETALVVHRMEDCQVKIQALEPKAAAQVVAPPPPAPGTAPAPDDQSTSQQPGGVSANNDEVSNLRVELGAVKEELRITKEKLSDSQAMVETYRVQLETVNQQLAAVKDQQSESDRMGKLLSDNKALTDKLAAAQKQIDGFKANPKTKLAMAQAQLKNLQDQYDASQEANKALMDTTNTLKQQLDQAQADLVTANQKLAAAPVTSPEYDTLKRENEIMRDILTRELQEQAHRDMAKRLAQEEFDNLKLKSKVLQEQLDILGSPMTPPTNDQERELLASLKVPDPDVSQVPANPNGFSANVSGDNTQPSTPDSTTTPPSTTDTNMASVTPPSTDTTTNPASPTQSTDTNQPPVNIVSNNTTPTPTTPDPNAPPATNTPPQSTDTNAVAVVTPPTTPVTPDPTTQPQDTSTPPTTPPPTNAVDPNAPLPPNVPPGPAQPASNSVTPPAPPASTVDNSTNQPPTVTKIPGGTEDVTDTKIQNNGTNADSGNDPTQYSTKARLPDDERDTAQEAADLFKNQRYDDSAAKYQSIIDKYPESLYAWSNLGVVRFQQGKFNEALKALQQAVKLSPTDAFSYSNLGIVYYQLNQYESAIDALNSAKALDPNDAKTHNYLGCAESQKGWQEEAEKEFRKAIEIDPNFGDAHFNLALVYATSKPPALELARREYNRALELGIAKDPRLEKLLQGPEPADTP
jgi:Flp pilus assembly protein TadD